MNKLKEALMKINYEGFRLMFTPKENICDIRRAIEFETEHRLVPVSKDSVSACTHSAEG